MVAVAPVTIPLTSPLTVGEATVDALTIREADLADLVALEGVAGSPMIRFVRLLSRLSGVPEDSLVKLRATDLRRIQVEAATHLGNVEEEAGATSPA
jgi:hypothetical protein